jgi:tRNA U38,U39,U40 pseudouridine synthase TruA
LSCRTDSGVHAVNNSGHFILESIEKGNISGRSIAYKINKFLGNISCDIRYIFEN